jgi:hypothetical protein
MTSSKINGWCHAGDFSFDFSDRKNPVLHVVFHISENEERNLSVRIKFDRRKRTKISIKLEFQQLILLFPYGFCRLSRRDLASLIIERADFLVSFFNDLAEQGKLPSDFSESGSSAGFHRSKDSDGSIIAEFAEAINHNPLRCIPVISPELFRKVFSLKCPQYVHLINSGDNLSELLLSIDAVKGGALPLQDGYDTAGDPDLYSHCNVLFGHLAELTLTKMLPLCMEYSGKMNLSFRDIRIRLQRTRWGSCSSGKNISFSCLLAATDEACCRYLAVHELAHLKHMDHSAAFWETVAAFCPDYMDCERKLHDYNRIYMPKIRKLMDLGSLPPGFGNVVLASVRSKP